MGRSSSIAGRIPFFRSATSAAGCFISRDIELNLQPPIRRSFTLAVTILGCTKMVVVGTYGTGAWRSKGGAVRLDRSTVSVAHGRHIEHDSAEAVEAGEADAV